jgi:hypothetical protein
MPPLPAVPALLLPPDPAKPPLPPLDRGPASASLPAAPQFIALPQPSLASPVPKLRLPLLQPIAIVTRKSHVLRSVIAGLLDIACAHPPTRAAPFVVSSLKSRRRWGGYSSTQIQADSALTLAALPTSEADGRAGTRKCALFRENT